MDAALKVPAVRWMGGIFSEDGSLAGGSGGILLLQAEPILCAWLSKCVHPAFLPQSALYRAFLLEEEP